MPQRTSWLNDLGLGPRGCLAVSGVSEYLLQTTRDWTMVHGAGAPNGLNGATPSRELMELSLAQRSVLMRLQHHDEMFAQVSGHKMMGGCAPDA